MRTFVAILVRHLLDFKVQRGKRIGKVYIGSSIMLMMMTVMRIGTIVVLCLSVGRVGSRCMFLVHAATSTLCLLFFPLLLLLLCRRR